MYITRSQREGPPNKNQKKYVSTRELAEYLGVLEGTVTRWARQKKITHYKLGNIYRFIIEEVEADLKVLPETRIVYTELEKVEPEYKLTPRKKDIR